MRLSDVLDELMNMYVEDLTIVKSPKGAISLNVNGIQDCEFVYMMYPITDATVDEIVEALKEVGIE